MSQASDAIGATPAIQDRASTQPIRRASGRSTRPEARDEGEPALRGLERGLQVLVYMNQQGRAVRVADVARGTSLPRTTAIRILDSHCTPGYVARPHAQAVTDRYSWPVALATPLGTSMVWRVNTGRHTGATLQRFHVGMRVPLHRSASALVFLAFASAPQRRTTLDLLGTSWFARLEELEDRRRLERRLPAVRGAGFATFSRPHERESTVSIPMLLGGRHLASLAARYGHRSIGEPALRQRYVGPLQQAAASISADFARLAGGA